MTQVFGADGELVPVTVVEAGPCTVVQIRTRDKDGYEALQVGFGTRREKRLSKAARGHMANAGRSDFASLAEVPVEDVSAYEVGQEIKAGDVFAAGDVIDVTGVGKGRGFAGVMRRYGFAGHRSTHGTHESFRGPGSVGAGTYPGHIWKGKRMPGQMGAKRRTIQNLRVVAVRADDNLILVRGGIPGPPGGDVLIRTAAKGQKR
jgi:large subunit ribosomal protein L3